MNFKANEKRVLQCLVLADGNNEGLCRQVNNYLQLMYSKELKGEPVFKEMQPMQMVYDNERARCVYSVMIIYEVDAE